MFPSAVARPPGRPPAGRDVTGRRLVAARDMGAVHLRVAERQVHQGGDGSRADPEIKKSPQYCTLSNRWGKPREMTRCMAGVLTAPFMKAALVIGVGHEEAGMVSPELGSALFFANYIAEPKFSKRLTADPALEWVALTRHPDELRTFLATIGR